MASASVLENDVARAEKVFGMVTTAAYWPDSRPLAASAASVSTQSKFWTGSSAAASSSSGPATRPPAS